MKSTKLPSFIFKCNETVRVCIFKGAIPKGTPDRKIEI